MRAFALSLFIMYAAAATFAAGGFSYCADAPIMGSKEYAAIRLTPEVYGAANENLSDILLSFGGNPLPYFLIDHKSEAHSIQNSYEMAIADSFVKTTYQYLDYKVAEMPEADILATSIRIITGDQFVKETVLFGGYDGLKWDRITADKLYNVDNANKLSISLSPARKYTWYRFQLADNQKQVKFDRVSLEYNSETMTTGAFIEELSPAFDVKEDGKTTVITITGVNNLPLNQIEIITDSMFKRAVKAGLSSETLYKLKFDDEEYKNLTLPMNGYKSSSNTLDIYIDNGDDAPIAIDSIMAEYLASDLVFKKPNGNDVTLYFGNRQVNAAPRYDIASYKEYVVAEGYDTLYLGEIRTLDTETAEKPSASDYSVLFNISIVAAALLLSVIIILRLRKKQ